MSAAKAKPSAIAPTSGGLSKLCAKIFKGFFRQFRAIGVKRPAELNNAPAVQAVPRGAPDNGLLGPEDKNAAMSFDFGQMGNRRVKLHIDPKEEIQLVSHWQHNGVLFHLDPRDLDRLQLFWLHCLLQDYDLFNYRGFFEQMAARCQVFQGPFTPQDTIAGLLARHQINLKLSPYLEKTFQLLGQAISQRWQGAPIEGRLAMMPGVVLFNFKCPQRPSIATSFLKDIVPSGAGPSEPIHLIVDYSQMPCAEATLAFFFVTTAPTQNFPIKEITILPRT